MSVVKEKSTAAKRKAVANWLIIGALMIIVQVALGGITRLTGSGLSITEWKPLIGAIPPLNEADWQKAFEKYQHIAQFKYMNQDFTLGDFKAIYFWEWLHRLWGRFMGIVFGIGFIYFLIRRYFDKEMVIPFVILFILGILQGLIGWIMVQSGLNETDLFVSHLRLAIHFMTALLLFIYVLWFALKLIIPAEKRIVSHKLYRFTIIIISLLAIQLTYGAFMAGLKAASAAATWPTINGQWLPETGAAYGSRIYQGFRVFTDHPIMVHLVHRTLAYILFFGIVVWTFMVYKTAVKQNNGLLKNTALLSMALVMLQVVLGIFTVINGDRMTYSRFGVFEWYAQLHQLVALFLLASFFINLYLLPKQKFAGS